MYSSFRETDGALDLCRQLTVFVPSIYAGTGPRPTMWALKALAAFAKAGERGNLAKSSRRRTVRREPARVLWNVKPANIRNAHMHSQRAHMHSQRAHMHSQRAHMHSQRAHMHSQRARMYSQRAHIHSQRARMHS